MDLGFLQDNWGWISSNWWGSIGLVVLGATFGAVVTKLYYQRPNYEVPATKDSAVIEAENASFSFPQFGRHGKNVLSNSVGDVEIGESLSLRASIPSASRISVEMRGPLPTYLDDTMASWGMRLGQSINWTWDTYKPDQGGKQQFNAEGGPADLLIQFAREGEVEIAVYEGESRAPSWTKTLHVHPAPRAT